VRLNLNCTESRVSTDRVSLSSVTNSSRAFCSTTYYIRLLRVHFYISYYLMVTHVAAVNLKSGRTHCWLSHQIYFSDHSEWRGRKTKEPKIFKANDGRHKALRINILNKRLNTHGKSWKKQLLLSCQISLLYLHFTGL
jgi:hypothetical protein